MHTRHLSRANNRHMVFHRVRKAAPLSLKLRPVELQAHLRFAGCEFDHISWEQDDEITIRNDDIIMKYSLRASNFLLQIYIFTFECEGGLSFSGTAKDRLMV